VERFPRKSFFGLAYALVLSLFPLIYYVTHPEVYYRRQIDPEFVLLAVYAVASRVRRSEANLGPEIAPTRLVVGNLP
jgi:hypothetical protein